MGEQKLCIYKQLTEINKFKSKKSIKMTKAQQNY